MACRTLAVPVIVVGTLSWNCLVAIRADGRRKSVLLVAQLAFVVVGARLDGSNL
jgi:hypothetical protein